MRADWWGSPLQTCGGESPARQQRAELWFRRAPSRADWEQVYAVIGVMLADDDPTPWASVSDGALYREADRDG